MSDEEVDNHSESTLNYRAAAALVGEHLTYESSGAAAVTDALCKLLRSPHPISTDVRELMATALDQGRSGYRPESPDDHVIRLVVEDLGPNAALNKAAQVRFNYLEAAQEYDELRSSGVKKTEAMVQAGLKRNLDIDSFRKTVLPYYGAFKDAIADPDNAIHDAVTSIGITRDSPDEYDEDYHYCFRSNYVWASAAAACRIGAS